MLKKFKSKKYSQIELDRTLIVKDIEEINSLLFDPNTKSDSYFKIEKFTNLLNKNPYLLKFDIPNKKIDLLEKIILSYKSNDFDTIFSRVIKIIPDDSEKTYLIEFVKNDRNPDLLPNLIKYCHPNQIDNDGNTALFYLKNSKIYTKLIEIGVNPNIKNKNEDTFLHHLLKLGKNTIILGIDYQKFDFTIKDKLGKTVLRIAIEKRITDVIYKFLENDPELKITTLKQDWFFQLCNLTTIALTTKINIINKIIDLTLFKNKKPSKTKKAQKLHNLFLALFNCLYDKNNNIFNSIIEKTLLERETFLIKPLLLKTNSDDNTLIHLLAINRDKYLLDSILRKHSTIITNPNKDGKTPYDLYIENKFKNLLKKCSDGSATPESSATPDSLITDNDPESHSDSKTNIKPLIEWH